MNGRREERERALVDILDRLPDLGESLALVLEDLGGAEVAAFARGFAAGRAAEPVPDAVPVDTLPPLVTHGDGVGYVLRPPPAPAGPWLELGFRGHRRYYGPGTDDLAASVEEGTEPGPRYWWWRIFDKLPRTNVTHSGRAGSIEAAKAAVDAILGPAPVTPP